MDEEVEQKARIALFQHYSSKCTAHGTNILAIVIAFFAWVEVQSILPFPEFCRNLLNGYIFMGFLVLGGHQIVRLSVWSKLTTHALWVPFSGEVEKNLLLRLNDACFTKLRRKFLWRVLSYAKRLLVYSFIAWIIVCFGFSLWFLPAS